jgi:EpsI family protein
VTRETLTTALLAAALVLVGSLSWLLALRPSPRLDVAPLASIPSGLGAWSSDDVPLESGVESMLRADFNLQRLYRNGFGDEVWVYFGYYGTERGGRPEHTPSACFRAHGWEIEEHRVLDAGPGLQVNELVVSLDGERQLVHYWFRSFRRTGLRGGFDQLLDHLVGRVFHQRADGSLVRLSTPLAGDDDRPAARSRLLQFATAFDELLAAHWPREIPDEADSTGAARAPGRSEHAGAGGAGPG